MILTEYIFFWLVTRIFYFFYCMCSDSHYKECNKRGQEFPLRFRYICPVVGESYVLFKISVFIGRNW